MKKFIAIICMTALLAGCGNTGDSSSSDNKEASDGTTAATTAEVTTEPSANIAIAVSSMEDAYRKVLNEAKNGGFESFSLFGSAGNGQELLAVKLRNDSGTTVRLYSYQQISGTAALIGEFNDTVRFYGGSKLVNASVYDYDSRSQTDIFYSVSDNALSAEKEFVQTFADAGVTCFIDGSEVSESEYSAEKEALRVRPGVTLGSDFSIDDDVISVVFNKNVTWQDAYSTYLLSCLDNENGGFSILDINGDGVPELFCSTGDGHVDYVRVFSLKDGLRGLGGYGTYGNATFYPDTEELLSSDMGMGLFSGSYYRLGNDVRFTQTLSFGDNSALDSNADEIVFKLNGQNVDEKEYRDELARRSSKYYLLGRDNALTAESANALANGDYIPPVLEDLQPVQNSGGVSENFRSIINKFYYSYELDQTEIVLHEPEYMNYHKFAICDIDNDGKDELVISVYASAKTDIATVIYNEDANGEVSAEYHPTINVLFYDNGDIDSYDMYYIREQNEKCGRFTPYSIYTYDAAADERMPYRFIGAWDQHVYPDGFPEYADMDGDGLVYYVSGNTTESKLPPMDYDELERLHNEFHKGASVVVLPFRNFTEEAINAIS